MLHVPTRRTRWASGLALLVTGAVALVGCSPASENADGPAETADTEETAVAGDWPREFENTDGTVTEIPEQPTNIVSTTVTATGTLLAIDAPVVASGSAANGQFFGQWADIAEEKGVENLFPVGEVDLEAIIAQDPDLIVVARGGADSLIDNVEELKAIAPTIIIDYGVVTWQELALELGEATGLEEEAAAAVADYDAYVADAATKITVPAGTANIFSFNGPGENNNIARKGSVHGDVLESLGFTLEDPPIEWHTITEQRSDFVFATYENLTELTSETTFILAQDDEGAQKFAQDPTMANVPSVKAGQVYGLGKNSFRVDKFSATQIVDHIVELFGS
ncbi:Fe2+-enterobactin ABC transporter substrate-binding protein [Microbacterium sp. No. 7]|uniref:Fe2+-enterobactin ABC transporter substrate-binding protein n=1 Tax=Microbacterium sp. No. 7 TaxID=1714373 RepID=UPI0006D2990D|nr:Fe2+-enterobactin ABC transporter substrate-binding protein [Microbacterium sp. No. 7]ALJ21576.1 antibiotic ABC transporter substrate-binding protein [Microbacterium sp. No. 7]